MSSLGVVLSTFVVALVTIFITHWVRKRRNPKCENSVLPPGSMGLPLIGETIQFLIPSRSLELHPFTSNLPKLSSRNCSDMKLALFLASFLLMFLASLLMITLPDPEVSVTSSRILINHTSSSSNYWTNQELWFNQTLDQCFEGGEREPLPLVSLNHVSLLVKSVETSVRFYEDVLGFCPIKRPSNLTFHGAWLFKNGIGIHLLEKESSDQYNTMNKPRPINPKDNHMAFQCSDVELAKTMLDERGLNYRTAVVKEGEIQVDQVFFHDPDGYMIEICNCNNLPISPCPFKKTQA